MKNLLRIGICGIALLCASLVTANAQSAYFVSQANGSTIDTVTNTSTKLQKLPIAGYQDNIGIQVILTSLTGTIAGTVRLFGSNDGIKFVRIPTLTDAGAVALDSLKVDVNTTSKIFRIPISGSFYVYYQAAYQSTTTQATVFKTYAIWRKR